MALTDKDIVITPNRGQSADPKVEFKGASSTLGPQTISLNVYPTSNGTLSFEGSAGQLFSITNTLTGTIYSVNDVSGIPSIEVLDTGLVKLVQYSGNVLIGTATDTGHKVRVAGTTRIDGGGSQPLTISTSSSSPWAFGLIRTDTGADSKIFLHNPGSGSAWVFEHIPYFYNGGNYNVPLHNGNYGSYALPLSGGTMTGVITTVSSGTAINFSGQSDSIGYNATGGLGTYIKGTGATYVYGGGSFYDGSAQRAILHAGNYSSYALPLSGGTLTGSLTLGRDLIVNGNTGGNYGNRVIIGAADTSYTLQDTNLRPTLHLHGQYPVVSLNHTVTSNTNHGPTLQFTNNGTGSQFVIGTNGTGTMLSMGYSSGTDWNPHNGIAGYNGTSFFQAGTNGYIGIGSQGDWSLSGGTGTHVPGYNLHFIGSNNAANGHAAFFDNITNATNNGSGFLFRNLYGNHSWGIVAEYRVEGTSSDRPSILFSHGYNSYTWSVGFGSSDDQFRINQNHGHRNGGWGTERFRIDTGGTPYFNGNVALHAGNYNSYAPTLTGGSASGTWPISVTGTSAGLALSGGFTIDTPGSGYARFNNWVNLSGTHGFYSSVNNAHIYPNNGSYGAWRVDGSRNSWNGIEFATNTGNVSLMIDVGGNTSGFHHNNYGWQMRWYNGTGYINKNAYGAGTEATILDSSNYTNYTNGIFLRAAGHPGYGDWNSFGNTQQTVHEIYQENFNAGTNTSSSNFPPSRGYNYGTLINFGANSSARAQVYISHAGNDLIFRGGWGTGSWNTWNRVLTDQIYNSYSPTLTGGGASGTWGINITGSAGSVPASGITGQTGMWTSAQRPGPYRLYRRDDNSDYSVQTYWTGARWRLYGYNGDTGHADTHVGYADSAGSSDSSGAANYLITADNRIIAPSEDTAYRMRFGFTSWNNNNDSPYADYLHMRSYNDSSGGSDNLVMFLKNGFGMRIWQQVFGSGSAYSDYRDVLTSGNYNSYAPTLTGGGASGTWGINITGNAATATSATDSTKLPLTGGTVTGATYFQSNLGATSGGLSGPPLQAFATGGNSAFMSFHRSGNYAVNFGLDSDNVLRIGGWSASANRWELDMSGNNWIPGRLTANAWTTSARNYSNEWIEFPNYSGLYSPLQGAHFYPNNGGSYGSWRIAGAKNGWYGIYFDSGSTLMMNSESVGFYREGYGWQMYWSAGTGYVSKGNPGGGTIATILESSNYTSYSPSLTGSGASGTWNINITGSAATATDSTKVPLSGGTMTGTLFINSKLRVNNASGPSDSTYGTAADIPMHMSGNTRTQTTFLIENTVNSSIDYPVIVIRRTLTPVGSRFGGMIRFADKNSSGTEISSQIYSFNRLTSQDLFLDAGSGTEDRVVLRAGSSSSMQVAENFIMNVKAAIYAVTTPAALDIDCKQSNYFTKTINGDSTFTFSNVPAPAGFTIAYSFTLELTHTSGTVTWPASVRWPGNVLPSLTTGKTHLFMFVTDDGGSRWRGSFLSNYDN